MVIFRASATGISHLSTKSSTILTSLTTNDYRNLRLYSSTPSTQLQDEIEAYEKNFRSIDIDDGLVAYYPLAKNSLDNYYNDLIADKSAEEIIISHLNMTDDAVNDLYDFYTVAVGE